MEVTQDLYNVDGLQLDIKENKKMNAEYYIGQVFEGVYPPEAANWCNANKAMIAEIEPIDGKRKFEIKVVPEPSEEDKKQARIKELKAELSATDYKIIKCSECSLAGTEMPYDIVALHTQRQAIRDEINQLEG